MSGQKKATVEALLARRDKGPARSVWADVPGLGMALEIRRLPLARYWTLTAGAGEDPENLLRTQYQMIYEFCPLLHEPALQAGYGVTGDPADIVPLVFEENLGDMMAVVEAINGLYGAGNEARDELKN